MSIVRKLFSIAVLVLMFVGVSSLLAGNSHETVTQSDVGWTIPAGQCSSLPAGLTFTGSGQRHMVVNTKEKSDGSTEIVINDVVEGDAVDSAGGTYHWKYSNHSIDSGPASGAPRQISMTDSFVLNGGGVHLNVGFNWRWSYSTPDEFFPPQHDWVQVNTVGDPLHCDPL